MMASHIFINVHTSLLKQQYGGGSKIDRIKMDRKEVIEKNEIYRVQYRHTDRSIVLLYEMRW